MKNSVKSMKKKKDWKTKAKKRKHKEQDKPELFMTELVPHEQFGIKNYGEQRWICLSI